MNASVPLEEALPWSVESERVILYVSFRRHLLVATVDIDRVSWAITLDLSTATVLWLCFSASCPIFTLSRLLTSTIRLLIAIV